MSSIQHVNKNSTSLKDSIDVNKLPLHVAIIMDGNGRWAKQSNKHRLYGHKNGINSVKSTVEAAIETGVKYLTLYAFSLENWNRPKDEVLGLMSLLVSSIDKEFKVLHKNGVRINVIGNTDLLQKDIKLKIENTVEKTKDNNKLFLTLALSYGSRWEIVEAAKKIAIESVNKKIAIEDINEQTFSNYLTTSNMPDPELLIRTSGEYRISNFLLYQIAYSELYFTETLWPDFNKEEFYKALIYFQKRERRFGLISEQINKQELK